MVIDRETNGITVIASTEGGMEIEEVAEKTPEKIKKIWVEQNTGITDNQMSDLINILNLDTDLIDECKKIIQNIYNCYFETDASLIEINPLIKTEQNNLVAVDAKFNFDSNSLYRHENIKNMEV